MKNKNLLFGLFSLILSLTFFFMAALTYAEVSSPDQGAGLNLNWIAMGPNNAAGRTRALIFDNRDATGLTIYAGGVTGGIWKSTNLGLTWNQMNTASNEVLRVTSLVQTSSGVIYAGTGESYCGEGQFIGTGLYRSLDGINFQLIPGTSPTANDPTSDWAYILKLAINSSGRLFAATSTGLKYSDNGDTWTMIMPGNAVDVKVGSDGTVLAAVNDSAYIAVNGDISNFRNMSTGGATGLPKLNVGWIEFAIAPSDPDIMYACLADGNVSEMMGVYRSEDKGTTWSVVFPYNNTYFPLAKNGCYAMTLAVFPNNPNMILLGGDNLWLGTQYLPTGYFDWQMLSYGGVPAISSFFLPNSHHAYVFRPNDPSQFAIATDNGVSIGTISAEFLSFSLSIKNYIIAQMSTVAINTGKTKVMGGGQNIGTQLIGATVQNEPMNGSEIWIDNGGGTDGGSGGYCEWSLISPNVVIFSQKSLTTEPLRRSEDLGVSVSPTFLGSISFPAADFIPTHLWESFDFQSTFDSVKYIARDSAISAGTVLTVKSYNAKFPFYYTVPDTILKGDSIMIPDVIQSRFFLIGSSGVYMTKDVLNFAKDPEWFLVSLIPSTDIVTCLAMSQELNYMWAGTANGILYKISNLALAHDSATANATADSTCVVVTKRYTSSQFPFLNGRYVTSIAIDPNDPNNVLVTLDNYGNTEYVYMTANALDTLPSFHSVQGNLPAMPVYSSLIEMTESNRVILGTEFGIFTTPDITAASPVWDADNAGLGNVPVKMIKQQLQEGLSYYPMLNWGIIYIASYGRGIFMDTTYYTPLGISPVTGSDGVPASELKIHPNPATGIVTVSYQLDTRSHPVLQVFDLTGRTVLTRDLGNETTGKHSITIDMTGYQGGTYILRLNWGTGNAYGKVVKIR